MRARRRVTPGAAAPWLLLALLPLLSHRGAAQVAPTATLTFSSTADTYADSGSATTNFNSSTALRADASPTRIIYLRFAVSGLSGRQVQKARLRLGVNAASPAGGTVHLISNHTWNEATVTYNTRPALDGAGLQTLGAVTAGATVEFTLDGQITADGVYDLAIDSTSSSAVGYNSSLATSGQKPQLVLTVAAQAPTVSIAQPPTGASYFTGDAITLQASAHDSAGVDRSAAVVWSSTLAGPLGTGAVVPTSLGQGTHTLTATVTDGQGLTGSSQISVTVTPPPPGNTAPLVSITAPASGQTLASSATITFTGSASDLEDGDLTAAIAWTSDRDGALGTGGTITHTLSEGTHQLTATVADRGGLTATATATVQVVVGVTLEFPAVADAAVDAGLPTTSFGPTLIVTAARAAPTVTIAAPAAGSIFFQRDAITFAAQARDAEDGELSSRIEWTSSRDGSLGTGATVTTSALTVGLHTVTAAVTDSGGLGGQAQTSIRVRAPNTPPAVTIASPADGSSVPAGTAVRLGAAASDDFDGDLTGQIRWTSSRDGVLGPNGTRLLSEGAHTLVAAVTDSDGAPGSATARLTVTPTPPVVTMVAPAGGTTVFAGTSLAFSGTATDATDGDLSAALRWLSDRDGQIGSGPSFTSTRLSTGTHSITAIAADAGGLSGEAVRRVVVRPPNVPPVVRVVAPAAGTTLLAGKPVLLAATAADVEDGDLGAALVWTSSRDGALGTGRTVVAPGLSLGTHTLTASVADRDGATVSASVTVTVVPSTLVFPPSADTYVDAGSASAKFGGATALLAGMSPVRQALLRFAVTGIGQFRVQQALLHMTVGSSSGDGSAAGGTVRAITNGAWSEATTTYNTRPAVDGAVLATHGSVTPKQVVDFDVTQGVAADGTFNFALVSTSSDWVRYASREASTGKPELRIALTQNTAPLVTILAPASGTRVLPGSPVAFAGAATDAEDGDLGSRIEWSSSLDGLLGAGAALTTTALRPGVHTITARATDTGGLVGQAAITVTVTHPPVVTIAAPADGTVVFTSGLPMTFTGRATDVEDGDLGARIAWSSDRDGALGTGPSVTAGALGVGAHVISARVSDDDGLR